MGLEVSLVNGAAKTTAGTQDYVGALNGATPAVSLFALCPGIGGGGFGGHYVSFGASDDVNSLFLNSYAVDNESTTTTQRGQNVGAKASVPVLQSKYDGLEEVYAAEVSAFGAARMAFASLGAPLQDTDGDRTVLTPSMDNEARAKVRAAWADAIGMLTD